MHATLADVIADTAQNSIEAGAKRIEVRVLESPNVFAVEIDDDGKGMSDEVKARVFDPFYTEPGKHDARKVGLGLPILKQICESCGGALTLDSTLGVGTRLHYHFDTQNIDLPPKGDLVKAVVMLFNYPGEFELIFTHTVGSESYSIARSELAEAVGSFDSVEGLSLAEEFLRSQEDGLTES